MVAEYPAPWYHDKAVEALRKSLLDLYASEKRQWRVLLVDDNPDDLEVLRRQLGRFDCQVTQCQSGRDAVSIMVDREFDLVFLDLRIPDLAGDEVISQVRTRRPKLWVVLCTAYEDQRALTRALSFGAAITLPKPITRSDLEKIFGTLK